MKRDLDRLREPFDLVVIGAGIYGAAIAWDATLRGLRVALIDRGDIGGGTSFNNAKTLHGGVRSLQGLRLAELREYVHERRALLRIAPHLVRPLTFVSPALGTLTRNRLAYRAYFRAYDLLARDRNDGVDPALRLGRARILDRDTYLALDPLSDPERVTGGVAWQDGQMIHGERVTLAFAKAAAARGAARGHLPARRRRASSTAGASAASARRRVAAAGRSAASSAPSTSRRGWSSTRPGRRAIASPRSFSGARCPAWCRRSRSASTS